MFSIVRNAIIKQVPAKCISPASTLRNVSSLSFAFPCVRSMQPQPRGLNARALYFSTAEFNSTVEESLKKWCHVFTEKNISEPLESIANILASILKTNNLGEVYNCRKQVLSDLQLETLGRMCEKRLEKMPVQYIVGEWDFRDITLKLRPPVFIPRPETEILVELVLQNIKKREINEVLELCCGSGAISCSLLHSCNTLSIITIDQSEDACSLCQENAQRLSLSNRITIENCSVDDFKSNKKFDLIVCNPPYVLTKEMKDLQPEILLYEDYEALNGGEDGLDVVKQIFTASSRFLNPGGRLFLEVDPSHPELIRHLLIQNEASLQLSFIESYKDLTGVSRFVEIIKN